MIITEAELGLDGFVETGPVRLSNVVLCRHLELIFIALDQLGHFEVERVGITASGTHPAGLLHVLALDDEASQW